MEIKLTRKAIKGLDKLPKKTKENAFEVLNLLENDESLTDWDVKKMSTGKYRVILDYRHRLRYSVEVTQIKVTYIGPREGAYKQQRGGILCRQDHMKKQLKKTVIL